MADESDNDRAQGELAKLQRVNDGKQAVADYEAAARPPAPVPARKKKAAPKPAGTLADWIKAREDGGHNN